MGLDLVELSRFRALYSPDDHHVLHRVFTELELAEAEQSANKVVRLAGRFAAKEAVLKVIGGLQQGTALTDIEILSTVQQPTVHLSGEALVRASELRIRSWLLSITHTESTAAAVVIAMD